VHPRKSIRDLLGLAGSQYAVRALLMTRGILAARLLGPGAYGAWNAIVLVLEYGGLSHLSTLQGLDQAVPGRIVDGEPRALDRLKRAALFNLLIGAGLFTLITLLYFARTPGQIRGFWGLFGIGVAIACAVLTNIAGYHTSILRSYGRIEVMSVWFVIQGTLGAVLGIALIPWLGAWGLLWGWFGGTVIATIYARSRGRDVVPLAPRPSADARLLLALGLPMFLYTGLNLLMRSLDRVIILRFLGTEDLGFYSLAVMAISLLLYLSDSAGYVMYPRLLSRFHASGGDPESIREPAHQVLGAVSLLLPLFCAFAYLAADDSVLWLLPKFREGVPALRILCFGAAALGIGNLCAIVLMVMRRQQLLVPVALGSVILGAIAMVLVIRAGFGIRGVAWVTLATYTLHSSVMLWLALGRLHENALSRLGTVVRLLAPLGLAIPLAYLCNVIMPGSHQRGWLGLARLVSGMVAFLVVYSIAVRPLARGLGLRQMLAEFRLPTSLASRVSGGGGGSQ
jgi:O-antigen/teichoic acid export membrane protein